LATNRLAAQDSSPSAAPANLSLPEIVDRLNKSNVERLKNLEHYQGTREYVLDYKGFPHDVHADVVVHVSFSAPYTQEFTVISETGSKIIVNRVIKPMLETEQESLQPANRDKVQITGDNYNFTLLDTHDSGDGCPYELGAEPKVTTKFLFRGKIWVDGKDFAVCRIEAEPARNPSFWIKSTAIHHSFMKVGDFWMPSLNNSASNIRLGGRATLTIRYEGYEIQDPSGTEATANSAARPPSN
jgi:hypothetical protein